MSQTTAYDIIHKVISDKCITEYHIVDVGTWEHFESLSTFFEQQYHAKITHKTDGIYTREWGFRCRDEEFILKHHEDIGNYFYSTQNAHSKLLETIAEDLTQRLRDVPYET